MILPQQIEIEELASASSLLATAARRVGALVGRALCEAAYLLAGRGRGRAVVVDLSSAIGASETEGSRPIGAEDSRPTTIDQVDQADQAPGIATVEVAVLGPIEIRGPPGSSRGPGPGSWSSTSPCTRTARSEPVMGHRSVAGSGHCSFQPPFHCVGGTPRPGPDTRRPGPSAPLTWSAAVVVLGDDGLGPLRTAG